MILTPPFAAPEALASALNDNGHAVLDPQGVCTLLQSTLPMLLGLNDSWNDLPPDAYLRDGGRYRRRRHSCFVVDGDAVRTTPHRAHWQPLEYNALHGGLERWFEPMDPGAVAQPVWPQLLVRLAAVCSAVRGAQPWFVEMAALAASRYRLGWSLAGSGGGALTGGHHTQDARA